VGTLAVLGYFIWPTISVSPKHVAFAGYPNETFNFSARNGTAEDVYDVQIPFFIGTDKHFEDKISAKVLLNGEPPHRMYDDYHYCYGEGDDVHKVLPHEREVFIVRIEHLAPSGIGNFSITYAGGDKFVTQPGRASYLSEPYSYSDMEGTIAIRGGYRICKAVIKTDGLEKK
jgi:hypothetical protein